ncbi:MAG: zinc ribbon domain-containing protein [Anaerolineae bacterium]|nr:zinc ribbon domain-containing protein [Anaerolineae bacterium]
MFGLDADTTNNLVVAGLVYLGMVAAAFWLAMIIWAYRDMRARSRDALAQWLVALLVAVLNLPGLLIYLFLRPRETLSEAYERSLEEEALLQEIEDKPVCPACRQKTDPEWQACPHCHTRLKKPCIRCGRMLELPWDLCPHCATPQPASYGEPAYSTAPAGDIGLPKVSRRERRAARASAPSTGSSGSIEFVDEE